VGAAGWLGFLAALGGLLLVAVGGYVAYRNWNQGRAAGAESEDRSRFLGAGGILLAAVFFGLTLVAGLSGLAFQPCRPV
jgi:hypothetical protein